MSKNLDRLARRVATDPYFLAAPLACYAESEGIDDAGLAARLGCPTEALTGLRLCRSPDPLPRAFWNDIVRIARKFGIEPDTLAEVVRFGHGLLCARLGRQESVSDTAGFLMAARDKEESRPESDRSEGGT